MKLLLISAALVGLIAISPVFAGGTQESTTQPIQEVDEPVQETVTVIDGYGREVTLNLPVRTVISGGLGATEAMTILGEQERMVSIDWVGAEYPSLYGDLTNLPVVTSSGNWYNPNFETIYQLDPDLFITLAGPMEGFDQMVSRLEPEIPVIAIAFDTPEDIMNTIEMLGRIFQREQTAAEYIDFYQGTLEFIKERSAEIPEDEKVRVYYEAGGPYFTVSKGFLAWHNHVAIPGGINVAADMQQAFGSIDPEAIIGSDPEVIISLAINYPFRGFDTVDSGYDVNDISSMQAFHESILNRPELSSLSAIKKNRVHVINSELPVTSVIGFSYFAKWLYPELFSDFDPQAVHQEYLDRFMRIDYDLDEHGVFVYPNP